MTAQDKTGHAARIEAVARAAYDRCHPEDRFDDMKRRAAFSKEDRGLLCDWLAAAAQQVDPAVERGRSGSGRILSPSVTGMHLDTNRQGA